MKRFNRKKLIPSLAASLMVAAATFAPLPSFLAAGSVVHADPASPAPFTASGSTQAAPDFHPPFAERGSSDEHSTPPFNFHFPFAERGSGDAHSTSPFNFHFPFAERGSAQAGPDSHSPFAGGESTGFHPPFAGGESTGFHPPFAGAGSTPAAHDFHFPFAGAGSTPTAPDSHPPFAGAGSHGAGTSNSLQIQDPSRLSSGGSVVVELDYKCFRIPFPNGNSTSNLGNITVTVTQGTAQGAVAGKGNDNANVICDGQDRQASVTVSPNDASKPLDVGGGFATATLTGKDASDLILAGPTTRDINVQV
jgi:hypothetical protein